MKQLQIGKCSDCNSPIAWISDKNGFKKPFNVDLTKESNIEVKNFHGCFTKRIEDKRREKLMTPNQKRLRARMMYS